VRSEQLSSRESESLAQSLTIGPPGAPENCSFVFDVNKDFTVWTVRLFTNKVKDSIGKWYVTNRAAKAFDVPGLIQRMHNVLKSKLHSLLITRNDITPMIFRPHFAQEYAISSS
jgi:hypothetical protein